MFTGVDKKCQETELNKAMYGITSVSYLKTDTTSFVLFLKIWDEPALLKPHVPESAFPQNICADGRIKEQLSALGYSNNRSHT